MKAHVRGRRIPELDWDHLKNDAQIAFQINQALKIEKTRMMSWKSLQNVQNDCFGEQVLLVVKFAVQSAKYHSTRGDNQETHLLNQMQPSCSWYPKPTMQYYFRYFIKIGL